MRVFCAAMLVLSVGLYATYDRFVKGAVADDEAAKLKEQKRKFGEELDELTKRFEKASTPAEQKGIKAEGRELATLTAEKVRKIAEADPKILDGARGEIRIRCSGEDRECCRHGRPPEGSWLKRSVDAAGPGASSILAWEEWRDAH